MDFNFLSQGGQPVQLQNPMQMYGRGLSLADLARRERVGQMQESSFLQQQQQMQKLSSVLPQLEASGWRPEVAQRIMQENPDIAEPLYQMMAKREKEIVDTDLKRSQAKENYSKVDAAKLKNTLDSFDRVAAVADEESRAPDHLSLSRVQTVAQRLGFELPPPADGEDIGGYLRTLKAQALSVKERLANDTQVRGQDMTQATAREGHGVTMRGQDMSQATAREGFGVTMRGQNIGAETSRRGQDLVSDRQREANEIASRAVSPAALQSLAQNEVTLAKIGKARDLIRSNPGATGLANYLPDAIRQRTDPEGVTTRALIADISGQKIHDRSGAAVTVGEAERLRPYVPNLTDDDKTVQKKLELFESEYQQIQRELAQGKSLADVVRGRSGEVRGRIGASSIGSKTVKWSDLQ